MNKYKRIKMVKCMEFIARQINNEDIFLDWLMVGVADGDISYGDVFAYPLDDDAEFYTDDIVFAELMDDFIRIISKTRGDGGGLYCDGVLSGYQKE